jgi:hypothetical protein
MTARALYALRSEMMSAGGLWLLATFLLRPAFHSARRARLRVTANATGGCAECAVCALAAAPQLLTRAFRMTTLFCTMPNLITIVTDGFVLFSQPTQAGCTG